MMRKMSRRGFLQSSAKAAATFTIVPRHVLGGAGHNPPSERLNIAFIGVGGKGAGDVRELSDQNLVAFCDVDEVRAAETFERFPDVKGYHDFRNMLEEGD